MSQQSLEQENARLRNVCTSLEDENKRLRQQLCEMKRKETVAGDGDSASFRERYAVKILDALPDMLTVFDMNETCIDVVSNEMTNHVGPCVSELRGTRMKDKLSDEAYANVHNNFEKVKATGKSSVAYHELDVDGEHRYFENRIFPLDGEYALVMCRDISDRVEAERKRSMFRKALDTVSDGVVGVSADGKLIYANKPIREMYGIDGFLKNDDASRVKAMWREHSFDECVRQIQEQGGITTFQFKEQDKITGQVTHHHVTAFVMQDDEQASYWFFSKDITEVIKSRDKYRELNRLLDAVLNNVPVYLFVKDTGNDFRYIYWNKAFAEFSKIPADQVLGKTDFEVFPNREDAKHFREDDMKLVAIGETINKQESYINGEGEARVVQTLKTLVYREGGSPLLVGVSWDMTDMNTVEQELVKARIKAEQSDRLKSAFLANMSHEIRTPLNSIVGFSSLMATAPTGAERTRFAGIIRENADILLRLINDVLDIAKIEAGTLEYVRRPINLRKIWFSIFDTYCNRMPQGVQMKLEVPPTELIISEDRSRLLQVIGNLVTNAIKFTRQGNITVGYTLEKQRAHCFVKDTGIGIAADKIDQVFERFVKVNTFSQGTGLGLSICKMLVQKWDGNIWVESEEGKGSVFHFTIPLHR
ncbi:MAG: PAS domain-containing protein [Prevotella sp.]